MQDREKYYLREAKEKMPGAHNQQKIDCVPSSQSGKPWYWEKYLKWYSEWWATISHRLKSTLVSPNNAKNKSWKDQTISK